VNVKILPIITHFWNAVCLCRSVGRRSYQKLTPSLKTTRQIRISFDIDSERNVFIVEIEGYVHSGVVVTLKIF